MRNNVKTAVILAAFGGLILLIGGAVGGTNGLTIALIIALVLVGGQYWFSDRIAIAAARAINKFSKDKAPKGISSQTQGDQVRVSGKKRDDLQAVIAALRDHDFGIPLQFENFRD